MDETPIIFEDWEPVLRAAVPLDRYRAYREAIVKFRYWLRDTGKSPDAGTFKKHLEWKKSYLAPERFEIRREALRWYYTEGLRRMKAAGQERSQSLPTAGTTLAPMDQPDPSQALQAGAKTNQGTPLPAPESKVSAKHETRMAGVTGYMR